jgi:hypothetical protein
MRRTLFVIICLRNPDSGWYVTSNCKDAPLEAANGRRE